MRSLVLGIVVVLVAAVVVTTPADAQRRRAARRAAARASSGPEFGGHLGYNFDIDRAIFGAQASFPVSRHVEFYPSYDYYAGNGGAAWGLNFDLKLRPPARQQFWYGGGGLNLSHSEETTYHLNLFAGFAGPRGAFRPYAEGRMILIDGSSFLLVTGVSFPLR